MGRATVCTFEVPCMAASTSLLCLSLGTCGGPRSRKPCTDALGDAWLPPCLCLWPSFACGTLLVAQWALKSTKTPPRLLSSSRLVYLTHGPHFHSSGSLSHTYMCTHNQVAWDLFFFTNFSFIYFIPCILYGYLTGGFGLCCPRRAALHRATREAEEAEAGEAASGHPPVLDGNKVTLMSFGAASMIAYAFTSKMLEVTGINILWMAPAVAVPWTAGLLIDRCVYRGKLISNNRGCKLGWGL